MNVISYKVCSLVIGVRTVGGGGGGGGGGIRGGLDKALYIYI